MVAFKVYDDGVATTLSLLKLVSSNRRRFVNFFLQFTRRCSRRWPGLDFCTWGMTECELLTRRGKDRFHPHYLACSVEKGTRISGVVKIWGWR